MPWILCRSILCAMPSHTSRFFCNVPVGTMLRAIRKEIRTHIYRAPKHCKSALEANGEVVGTVDPEKIKILLDRDVNSRVSMLNTLYSQLSNDMSHDDIRDIIIPSLNRIGITMNFVSVECGQSKKISSVTRPNQKSSRLPFREFTSSDGLTICVGRSARDNDKLSCDAQFRHDWHWWLHVSGYPGSHVVVRYQEDDLLTNYPNTLLEASLLAAKNSKTPSHKCAVSVTRCKYVIKTPGTPDGLVMLKKVISTVDVDLNGGAARLAAITSTQQTRSE